jgi:MFS family permease
MQTVRPESTQARGVVTTSLKAGRHGTQRRLPWPKRVDIAVLCFVAVIISHCDRINISVAAPFVMKERHWDTAQMGWVLSGFFFGYTTFMVLTGYLADRFGPKLVFGASVVWWSVFTALTPAPGTVAGMAVVRGLMGIGESGTNSCTNSIIVRWFPPYEYSRATSFAFGGAYLGPILALPLAAAIAGRWGWEWVFYVFGSFGFLWLPFWILAANNRPETTTSVPPQELQKILEARPVLQDAGALPWQRILALPAFWAIATLHFSANWIYYMLATWLPTYLLSVRGFSLKSMAIGSALPFLSAWVGLQLFGTLIDLAVRKYNRTLVRKLFLIPFAGSAAALLIVPHVSGQVGIVLLLCLASFLLTSVSPTLNSASLEIAPRYAGTFMGFQNTAGNLAGVLVPVVVGTLAKSYGWNVTFWSALAISTVGIGMYAFLGQTEKLID